MTTRCKKACAKKLVCKRVEYRGTVYRCANALAKTLGVTRHAVYQSLYRKGNLDTLGSPRGGPVGQRKLRHARPVSFAGKHWPSVSAMARDLGVSRHAIRNYLEGAADKLLALVMKRYP